ncbi:MAG: hypothetical protein ACRCWF_04745 [Beijerinckiaceae bacterium]
MSDGFSKDGNKRKGRPVPWVSGAYETWTYGRGAAYAALTIPLSEARYVPAVIELPPGATPEALAKVSAGGSVQVLLPLLWNGLERGGKVKSSWPALIDFGSPDGRLPLNAFDMNSALVDLGRRAFGNGAALPVFTLGPPLPTTAVSTRSGPARAPVPDPHVLAKLNPASGQPRRKLVVMAVIDDGIPFAHRNLLNAAGDSTRVEYCLLQSQDSAGQLLYGKHFMREDIDALRAAHGPDEDAMYHSCGAVDASSDCSPTLGHFGSHGAHVIDAAAGKKEDGIDLDLMRIIAVQLPASVTIDTAGFRNSGAVMAAMHYIFSKADDIARAYLGNADAVLPLVINFSYGITGGPHDGSDKLEIDMAKLVATRKAAGKPTTLVMPAGNSFADRILGEISAAQLATGNPCDVPWRLQPNDATTSYLEIWIPASVEPARFVLKLTSPQGHAVTSDQILEFDTRPGSAGIATDLLLDGRIVGDVDVSCYNDQWTLVRIALVPTEPREGSLPAAPAGLWTISLAFIGGAKPKKPVACRIHRDTDPYGYQRGGKQSYFDDQSDIRFTCDGALSRVENPSESFVKRFGTVNGIATHDQVTVVSTHFGDTGRATDYAGAGPRNQGLSGLGKVAVSMPADASTALRGSLASGTRSGSAVRMSGTSMAAPLYARQVGLRMMSTAQSQIKTQDVTVAISSDEAAERGARLGTPIAG